MSKLLRIVLCIAAITVSSYGISISSVIDKCHWDDKKCLIASAQKALGPITAGIPELGLKPLDPIHVKKAVYKEGDLSVIFENLEVTGCGKCKILDVERKLEEHVFVKAECPFAAKGTYTADGKLLFVDVQGHGPFHVKLNKVIFTVKAAVKSVVKKGVRYWKPGKYEYTFDVKEKAIMKFENLFNGDKQKAEPIEQILDSSWYELIQTVGKVPIQEIATHLMESIKSLAGKVPADELEL